MVPLQLAELVSVPGLLGAALVVVGVIVLVRFVISLAIKAAIIGAILLGTAMLLNQLFGLGLPVISGLTIAG